MKEHILIDKIVIQFYSYN